MIFSSENNTLVDNDAIWFDSRFVTTDWFINVTPDDGVDFTFMTTTEHSFNDHVADTMVEALRVMRDAHILGEGVTI